jgi:hypothetical protein
MMKESIKEYLKANCEAIELRDIVEHGCSGGIGGFIYYAETVKFHDEHEDEIWEMLWADANEEGLSVMELIESFGGSKYVGSMAQLKKLLCWYAVECVAGEIVEEQL